MRNWKILLGICPITAIAIWYWLRNKKAPIALREDRCDANTSIGSSLIIKKDSEGLNVSLASNTSSTISSIGAQVCRIIENSRLEFTRYQVKLNWQTDAREILCPSVLLKKRDKCKLSYDPSTFESMDNGITDWTLHTKKFYYTGTLIVPAGNVRVVLKHLHKNALISIMDAVKMANELEQGWYVTSNDPDNKHSHLREAVDSFIFASTFYHQLILAQLFENANQLEFKHFEDNLWAELEIRSADDLMVTVSLERLRAQTCKCMISDHVFAAQRVAIDMKSVTEALGFSIYLNFDPDPFCGECYQDYQSPLLATYSRKDWPDKYLINEFLAKR